MLFGKRICWSILLILGYSFLFADDFFRVKDQIEENYWFKLAGFYIMPTLSIRRMGYSTNIYQYDQYEASDWTADIGADISIAMVIKNRFIIQFREFPYFTWYARNTQNRSWNNIFAVTAYTYLGPFNIKYKFERPNTYGRPTVEFGRRVKYQNDNHLVSLDYGSYKNFFLNIYASQQEMEYKELRYLEEYDVQSLLDRRKRAIGVGMHKIIFTRTRIFLNYEYFEYRFAKSSQRDGNGGQISLGMFFPPDGRITGSLHFGYRVFQPQNPEFKKFAKPFGSGKFSLALGQRMRFRCEYRLDNNYSFSGSDVYYDHRTIRAGIEYYLNRRIKVGYYYAVGIMSYRYTTTGIEFQRGNFKSSSVILGFRLLKNMGIGLFYSTSHWDNDVEDQNRDYKFIGGSIIYDF